MMKKYRIVKIVQKDAEIFELFLEKTLNDQTLKEQMEVQAPVLASLGILKPCEITSETYSILNEKKQYYRAYSQALNFLSYRKRSVEEMRGYLTDKEVFTAKTIQDVLEKLAEQNYLNDIDFAYSYVDTALKTSLKGPRKIREELGKYGCDSELILNVLADKFSEAIELTRLKKVFEKMQKKKYVSYQQMLQKYDQKATALGYSYDIIQKAKQSFTVEAFNSDEKKIIKILERDYSKARKKGLSDFEIKQKLQQRLTGQQMSYDEAKMRVSQFLEEYASED